MVLFFECGPVANWGCLCGSVSKALAPFFSLHEHTHAHAHLDRKRLVGFQHKLEDAVVRLCFVCVCASVRERERKSTARAAAGRQTNERERSLRALAYASGATPAPQALAWHQHLEEQEVLMRREALRTMLARRRWSFLGVRRKFFFLCSLSPRIREPTCASNKVDSALSLFCYTAVLFVGPPPPQHPPPPAAAAPPPPASPSLATAAPGSTSTLASAWWASRVTA